MHCHRNSTRLFNSLQIFRRKWREELSLIVLSGASHGRSLTLLMSLGLFSFSMLARAQIDSGCAEAASLWIPAEASNEKSVIKWNRLINYGIFDRNDNAASAGPIEELLRFFAVESGLRIEAPRQATVDLTIVTVPDISTFAPSVRKFVESYFEDIAQQKGMKGRAEIEPDAWERQYKAIVPKCAGLDFVSEGIIERAFVLIQQGEPPACGEVGLGELFGLTNIRRYYADRRGEVSTQTVARALRTLYDKRVRAGANRKDANNVVGELCK
jgi:hypothetical protein